MGGETLIGLVGAADNFHEPVPLANKRETVLGVIISLQLLTYICAFLRLWTRFRVVRAPWWDDLFVVLALISTSLGSIVISVGATSFGLGKHFLHLGGEKAMSDYLKGFYIANGSYMLSTTFVKMALLLQYLRVFNRGSFFYRFSVGMAVLVGLWGLAFVIVAWFPCSPIHAYWSLAPEVNCWGFASQNPQTFNVTFAVHTTLNMVLDLIVLAIPVRLYFQLDTQDRTRWGLVGILLLGAVASFAAIWRLATIVEHKAATSPTFDPSWYGCISIVLGGVEVDMAVVCASVPVFWPVLRSTGFQIFITKEVEVRSESRLRSVDYGLEGIELNRSAAMPAGADSLGRSASLRSQAGSEEILHPAGSGHGSSGSKSGFFEDKVEQVDLENPPWSKPATQVSVSANPGATKP